MPNSTQMTAAQFAARADAMVGLPYILGAEWAPSIVAPKRPKALDCSELVEGLYREAGCPIGDLAAAQYDKTVPATGSPRIGDLVFLRNNPARWNRIGHVAVITAKLSNGDYRIVEARGRAAGTVRTTLSYWKTRKYYTGLRRFPGFALAGQVIEQRTLKRGSAGADVVKLQQQLNELGANLIVDGDFGAKTEAAVEAVQRAANLKVDGEVGPKTRAALASDPPKPLDTPFWATAYNCEDPRFGGKVSDDLTVLRTAAASVYLLVEAPEKVRNSLRKGMPGGASRWLPWTRTDDLPQAILFDAKKWRHTTRLMVTFGPTTYHGAVVAVLTRRDTGQKVQFAALHLPPKSVATEAERKAWLDKLIRVLDPKLPTVIGGDFNSATAAEWLQAAGFVVADTPATTDHGKRYDYVAVRGGRITQSQIHDPGAASDHLAVRAHVRIPFGSQAL